MPPRIVPIPPEDALDSFHGILSQSDQMTEIFVRIQRAARADCTVQIVGETGTGKELVARALHDESPRSRGPYRAINLAAIPATLLESELFGHKRGAFTGAVRDNPGLFAACDEGTLFLDEVSEFPYELQGKLLRVLQEKSFLRVGSTRPITADVRIVSATNRPLQEEIARGRFRADLNYRLRVVPIYIPPLRKRPGDIEHLFWHFVRRMNERRFRRVEAITARALEGLVQYPWPGNVRELQNFVECALIVGEGPVLDLTDFTPEMRGVADSRGRPLNGTPTTTGDGLAERNRIERALRENAGHKGRTARALGISRQTLWRKLAMHGLA